jgi:hypothetical protein
MIINCDKCKKLVDKIEVSRDDNNHIITIDAYCHNEKDSMLLHDEWIAKNQDFVMMIENNMTIGVAFKQDAG